MARHSDLRFRFSGWSAGAGVGKVLQLSSVNLFGARGAVVISSSSLAALVLSGCGLFGSASEPEGGPAGKQTAEVEKVLKVIEPLTQKDGIPTSEETLAVLQDGGYKPENIAATLDESPLGHDVPSKVFAVKVKKGCVIGEIRNGGATAALYPPLKSNKDCLLGEVVRPKGVKMPAGEKREEGSDDNGAGHLPGEDMHKRKDN